jgi:hypothetical protein
MKFFKKSLHGFLRSIRRNVLERSDIYSNWLNKCYIAISSWDMILSSYLLNNKTGWGIWWQI